MSINFTYMRHIPLIWNLKYWQINEIHLWHIVCLFRANLSNGNLSIGVTHPMIKKIMLASCLLVASMASQAALISYNGYERDTAKNYVTGGGLEWLMWDVTKGVGINSALDAHTAQGWRLATNLEMATLFNKFLFGSTIFTSDEYASMRSQTPWSPLENSPNLAFMSLFGTTGSDTRACGAQNPHVCYPNGDYQVAAKASYGSDDNHDGMYGSASVFDDSTKWTSWGGTTYAAGAAGLWGNSVDPRYNCTECGVALVRNVGQTAPIAVPTSGSIGLLALGLVALGYRRRQVSRR